ncbi:MAG: peptidylprolyl isomerase [Succinivibrionaceae bacterium]
MLKNTLLLLSVTTSLLFNAAFAETYTIDKTVAVANNDIILQSQLDNAIKQFKKNMANQGITQLPNEEELRTNILNQLIEQSLILQIAKKNSFTLSETDIDEYIKNIAKTNNTTVDNIIADFKSKGVSEANMREEIKNNIIINEVKQSQVSSRINISEQEIQQLAMVLKEQEKDLKIYHLASILIDLPNDATPAQVDKAVRKVKLIQNELNNNIPFSRIAQKYSEDKRAIYGGDLGELTLNDLPQYLATAIANSKENDVVGPIRGELGLIMLKVYDIKPYKPKPMELVKLRHILLTTSIIFDDEKAESELSKYRQEIVSGQESFEKMAQQYSQDPSNAFKGGEIDWVNPQVFDTKFQKAIEKLKENEISEPFKTRFGWHLVLLEGRKLDYDSLNSYKLKAREIIYRRTMNQESERWLKELRDTSYVKIY